MSQHDASQSATRDADAEEGFCYSSGLYTSARVWEE
jgi:hypothetical protein